MGRRAADVQTSPDAEGGPEEGGPEARAVGQGVGLDDWFENDRSLRLMASGYCLPCESAPGVLASSAPSCPGIQRPSHHSSNAHCLSLRRVRGSSRAALVISEEHRTEQLGPQ